MIIRVKFGKEGALRYIGHLDVLRTFQKIFRRAGIPMAYSQGFSPHPIMSFALPLGLGLSSEGEYLDAEIEWPGGPGEGDLLPSPGRGRGWPEGPGEGDLLSALRSATSPDLPIYGIRQLPEKAGNAMASVGRALYRLEIEPAWVPSLEQAAKTLLARESLMIEKETKTRTVEMDLRPCIYRLEIEQGEGPGESGSKSFLTMEIAAGSKANVKPETVWQVLTHKVLDEPPRSIRRLDLLTEEGISLGAIGEEL